MHPEHDSLRTELAALRRQVRLLLLLLCGAVLLAAAAFWQGLRPGRAPLPAEDDAEVLVGRSLYLREGAEEPYVRLKYLHDGAGLILGDSQGRGQVMLTALADSGRLTLGTAPARVELDAAAAGPSLTLRDGQGRPRVLLSAGQWSRLALLDERRQVRVELAVGAGGPEVILSDAHGRPRARLAEQEGSFRLQLLGPRGEVAFEAPPRPGR